MNKYNIGDKVLINFLDLKNEKAIVVGIEKAESNPKTARYDTLNEYVNNCDTFCYVVACEDINGKTITDTYYEEFITVETLDI